MDKKPRRTPEQLAAHHQRMANIARAKAKRAAKDAQARRELELGRAAISGGFEDPADLAAARVALNLLEAWFGPNGRVKVGEKRHWVALDGMARPPGTEIDFDPLVKWWDARRYPVGAPSTGPQGS